MWILLDIRADNEPDNVMRQIAETIVSIPPSQRAWTERVVLGTRIATCLPLCEKHLPGFPVTHIGFSTCYARQFLQVPNVSFNMLEKVLVGPIGTRFIRDVRRARRPLFVWTVNENNMMKWSIQKEVDGVITDDPKKFHDLCDQWTADEPLAKVTWAKWLYTFWLYVIFAGYYFLFKHKFPEMVGQYVKREDLKASHTLRLLE